jgi:choline-sulfatase
MGNTHARAFEKMNKTKNILIIMSDQHNPKMLGYENTMIQTPNLDRLAEQGTIFDRCYTPCPLCVPARMAFITGRYPHDIGVLNNSFELDSEIPTFAHSLTDAGYDTRLIGRMHFVGHDQNHGFEQRLVGDITPIYPGLRMNLGRFSFNAGATPKALQNSGAGITAIEYYDDAVTEATVDAIQENHERPFMFVTGFYRPHSPYRAQRKSFDLYDGKVELAKRQNIEDESDATIFFREKTKLEQASKEDELRALTAYCALLTETDSRVGKILEAIDEAGLAQDTIIIYTSDHGDHVGSHNRWWKHSFYEESARVPLIVRHPDFKGGERTASPVSLMDIAASIIEEAGAEQLPDSKSESFMPLLAGKSWQRSEPVMSEYAQSPHVPSGRMVINGDYKYIYHAVPEIENELYCLQNDPDEYNNLIDSAETKQFEEQLFKDGWNPPRILNELEKNNKKMMLVSEWAKNSSPEKTKANTLNLPEELNKEQ